MIKFTIPAAADHLEEGLAQIEAALIKCRIKGKNLKKNLADCENVMKKIIQCADGQTALHIKIKRFYITATITLYAEGHPFDAAYDRNALFEDYLNRQNSAAMRSLIQTANADNVTYQHKGGCNIVTLKIGDEERLYAARTIFALLGALVFSAAAFILLPEGWIDNCIDYVLEPIQTLFLNLLQLVTAPAVFFSIMIAVTKFASFTDLERIEKKTIIGFLLSAVVAVAIAIVLFIIFDPTVGLTGILKGMVSVGGRRNSVLDTLLNSVPNNIVSPFLNVDSLQLLIIAVICGIALRKAGEKSPILNQGAEALHRFFSTTVDIVTNLIPTAVFFVTVLMIFSFGFGAMLISLQIFMLVMLGFVILIVLSVLAVGVIGHLNPIPFVKKIRSHMFHVFWVGSSVSTVPESIELCEKKLGISPKVHSFAIPFGAIADLDGNCLYMVIAGLALTELCGTNILGQDFVTVAFMVMVLSIGSAITPGSAMLALILLMGQMKVSLMVICLVLGVNAIMEMALAMSNNVREIAAALIIAKQENLLDEEKYKAFNPEDETE